MPQLESGLRDPVIIESVELLRIGSTHLVRSRSRDGAVGLAVTTPRISYLHPLLTERVAPYFVGKDARQLDALMDGVYLCEGNYKLTGLPFWCSAAWVELSLLDLLGRVADRSVAQMMGGPLREEVPIYLSLLGRDSAPEVAAACLGERMDQTGAMAVKVKIGGRMTSDPDREPARSEALVARLRSDLGDDVSIFVDANGSFDSSRAIEIGRRLEAYGVSLFEEPCPFESYGEIQEVTRALSMDVAGGEQDSSLYRWRQIIADGVVDLPQPDLLYLGGFVRTAKVAAMAAARQMPVWLHNPHSGPTPAYVLQCAAALPNATGLLELNVDWKQPPWCHGRLQISDGRMTVPTGPGLGVDIDRAALQRADRVKQLRRVARSFHGFAPVPLPAPGHRPPSPEPPPGPAGVRRAGADPSSTGRTDLPRGRTTEGAALRSVGRRARNRIRRTLAETSASATVVVRQDLILSRLGAGAAAQIASLPGDISTLVEPVLVVDIAAIRWGGRPERQHHRGGLAILDGDWDLERKQPIEEYLLDDGYSRSIHELFVEGRPYTETAQYRQMVSRLERGETPKRCRSLEDVHRYFAELHLAYRSVETNGYRSQVALGSGASRDEITVYVDRNGELHKQQGSGHHRLAIARLLGVEEVPVCILGIHRLWVEACQRRYGGDVISAVRSGVRALAE
jgi:L-alanine-DL-glutamate epimerase-like enolase superfamily enzyme